MILLFFGGFLVHDFFTNIDRQYYSFEENCPKGDLKAKLYKMAREIWKNKWVPCSKINSIKKS